MSKGDSKKAEELVASLKKSFENDPSATFCASIADIDSERKKGNSEKASGHFKEAVTISSQPSVLKKLPKHSVLRFAVECFSFNEEELGKRLLLEVCGDGPLKKDLTETAVRYAADEAVKAKIRSFLTDGADASVPEEPAVIPEEQAVVENNPDGGEASNEDVSGMEKNCIEFAKSGDWKMAVKVSKEEAARFPNNPDAQFIAAQMLLAMMEKTGWNELAFDSAEAYLAKAKGLSP